MHIRRFFLWSLVLAVFAVGLDMAGLSQNTRSARTIAQAVRLSEGERADARLKANVYRVRGTVLGFAGLVFAGASLVVVIMSARLGEPAWRSATYALLVFYVMLQFAL